MPTLIQFQPPLGLQSKRAARAFSQDSDVSMQVKPGLKVWLRPPLLVPSLVTYPHTYDPVAVEKKLYSGKLGKNVNSLLLAQFGHPSHDATQRSNLVSVILQGRRGKGRSKRPRLGEKVKSIVSNRPIVRGILPWKVCEEFVESSRIDDGAAERMRTNFSSLFNDHEGRLENRPGFAALLDRLVMQVNEF